MAEQERAKFIVDLRLATDPTVDEALDMLVAVNSLEFVSDPDSLSARPTMPQVTSR
jgi:hypothetical protein